jgi:protein-disulfide isomerase
VLVIVSASALIWTLFFKQPPAVAEAPPPISDVEETVAATHLVNVEGSGSIAIVEFTDFQCPFCARHQQDTFPTLKRDLIDTGKARYITMHLPLRSHPQAMAAAEAAQCAAAQGKFPEMREQLFGHQNELAAADYASFAASIGLDTASFAQCLREHAALPRVAADEKEAERLGVKGTPTLFIGRVRSDGGVDLLRRLGGALPLQTILDEFPKVSQG